MDCLLPVKEATKNLCFEANALDCVPERFLKIRDEDLWI